MDLFDKIKKVEYLQEARIAIDQGIYPFFLPLEETEGTEVVINGRRLIMLGSNNYLGLTTHPKVKEAAIKAIKEYGTSCTGSRFMNGTLKLHKKLEEKLAEFLHKEAALVFSTGYQTNLGTISALISKGDIAITDKEDHASIIDGCRLSQGEMKRFKHNDMEDLEKVLASCSDNAGKLVIVDGVFSMAGDIAPLPEIVKLCEKYGARLMVDDAHSIGVLGDHGRGTANHFGLEDKVDIIMGTFSKSFASLGGFIAGDEDVIFYIQHTARSFIFSASMSPANTAAALAALEVMQEEPERIDHLWKIANRMREGLKSLGFDIGNSCTPIIPIYIRDRWKTIYMWKELFDLGVYCNPVLPPGVPPNQSLLRTSYMATHTEEQIDRALEIFEKAGKKVGII
ncbi:aminotransferase class I/II-fold pyridoxal phosphate-dependent enzyme [Dictyoglomus sp.]|uniref:aminotransferase class I/II-fold pyridoxal phosphate-dependent enzyme n=1 Tax=Dictyoglomus sp. TaxID=28205 RepID=UPI003D09A5B3